jgi:hypothetical protein
LVKRKRIDERTRALCIALARVSGNRIHWQARDAIAEAARLDEGSTIAAIAQSVECGWLLTKDGPPHCICLTDKGRAMAMSYVKSHGASATEG